MAVAEDTIELTSLLPALPHEVVLSSPLEEGPPKEVALTSALNALPKQIEIISLLRLETV